MNEGVCTRALTDVNVDEYAFLYITQISSTAQRTALYKTKNVKIKIAKQRRIDENVSVNTRNKAGRKRKIVDSGKM